jgi:hypothetical protein
MILLGFGAGLAFNPVLLAAMGDVEASESGLASGIVNTSFMMGGALGLAILASLAASRTGHLLASGHTARRARWGLPARVPDLSAVRIDRSRARGGPPPRWNPVSRLPPQNRRLPMILRWPTRASEG